MNAQQPASTPSVSVTGEGTIKVLPDEAAVKVSAEHSGKEALTVKQENDVVINEVLKFCKSLKIEKKDIQTERVNLRKNYDYQLKTYNYVASQSITIALKDLKKYEALLQGLLNSGINRIDGVDFKTSKLEMLEKEARKKAMLNAKMKATEYAAVIGQEIGPAIQISEGENSVQPFTPVYKTSMSVQSAGLPAKESIAVGELEITAKVQVVFRLKTTE